MQSSFLRHSCFKFYERRRALCSAPFSKEFFITTGYSKLQVPDDYLELVRVIVWNNINRLKKGDTSFSLEELERFLRQEMAQDFSDLGIDIDNYQDNRFLDRKFTPPSNSSEHIRNFLTQLAMPSAIRDNPNPMNITLASFISFWKKQKTTFLATPVIFRLPP
jgi:hypothetical protein